MKLIWFPRRFTPGMLSSGKTELAWSTLITLTLMQYLAIRWNLLSIQPFLLTEDLPAVKGRSFFDFPV